MNGLPDTIADLERELDRLRQAYEADPRNFGLGLQLGRLQQRVIGRRFVETNAQRLVDEEKARAEDRARWERRQARPHMTVADRMAKVGMVVAEVHGLVELGMGLEKKTVVEVEVCPVCLGKNPADPSAPYPAIGTMYAVGDDRLQCEPCGTVFTVPEEDS